MLNKTKFLDQDNYINLISIKPTRFYGSKDEIETYLQNFNKWKTANIIENESFHDTKWSIRDKDYNRRGMLFDIELYGTLNIALKCYAIHLIDQLLSVNHIHNVIRAIKESIHISKAFNLNHLIDLEEYISKQNYRKRYELAKYTIDFFRLLKLLIQINLLIVARLLLIIFKKIEIYPIIAIYYILMKKLNNF